MIKRLIKLFGGCTLASFAITSVLKANMGCFATTAMNVAFSNWFHISIGTAGFLVELLILAFVIYFKEGLGLTAIVNMTWGSIMIDVFNFILPTSPFMLIFLPLVAVGWKYMGEAGFGDTNSNLLTTAILKRTNKKIGLVRGIQECIYLAIGFFGARNVCTLFTLILSIFFGYVLQVVYKLLKYDPTTVKHQYFIKRKN